MTQAAAGGLSEARGIPLAEEPPRASLTLGGYLREVTSRYAAREVATIRLGDTLTRWSYADLWDHSMAVARALRACGVSKGTRVGLVITNRLEFLSCLFGTALAGGVATPISTFFTAAELDQVLEASACKVLLIERHVLKKDFAAMVAELEPQISTADPGTIASLRFPYLTHVARVDGDDGCGAVEGWSAFLARGDAVSPALVEAGAAAVSPADPGALFFSSGSTGKAKGILSSHRGVTLQLWRWAEWYRIEQPPRTWSANGFFFSGNFAMTLGGTLSSGGTIVLQRWFDPAEAVALLQAERVTMPLAWPHQWPQLEAAPGYAQADFSALVYADAAFPLARHPTAHTTWTEPGRAYGSTEAFTLVSVYPAGTPEAEHRGSHGLPTAGSTIRIVDPLTGAVRPLGERGEIAIKGPTLMMGYLGIASEDTFDAEGFFRTGDGGWIDAEGRLFWEGRLNDIIKTGGANVSPLEIDAVLRDCAGVKIVQTVGVPDDLLGEVVVSCVVPVEGATLAEDDVKACAKQSLAAFKVPRHVLFFAEDELATTGSAKIKTADLRKLAAARLG